jgi:hypothetical protein
MMSLLLFGPYLVRSAAPVSARPARARRAAWSPDPAAMPPAREQTPGERGAATLRQIVR